MDATHVHVELVRADLDGRPITAAEGRRIIAERYAVPEDLRQRTTSITRPPNDRTSRRSKESPTRSVNRPVHHDTNLDVHQLRAKEVSLGTS